MKSRTSGMDTRKTIVGGSMMVEIKIHQGKALRKHTLHTLL
jgi:hypothetical protein